MSFAIGAVLIIVGLVGAAALAVGVPLFFGVMAYDLIKSRRTEAPRAEDATTRIAVARGVARAFVIAGGAFWTVASFAGLYSYGNTSAASAMLVAFAPLFACAATLIVGWYYERFTAALLLAASLAVVAWGVIYQFEIGVWILMGFALLGPMLTSSALFWLARRDQEAYERATALRPQLALAFAARSSIR